MMKKGNLAALGFEPTPPKRLVPKTSALEHSATLPDMLDIGPKHCKSRGAQFLFISTDRLEKPGCCRYKLFKVKSRSAWLPAHQS